MSTEQPIACDFTAIAEDERNHHEETANTLFRSVQTWKELENGFAFRIPTKTDLIEKAGSFIARERLCCPFFNFSLDVPTNHGPVWLNITGTDRVKSYIADNVIPQLGDIEDDGLDLPENATVTE